MNEHIEKLAKQAINELHTDKEGTLLMTPVFEKFAELLVKECATVINAQKGIWPDEVPCDVVLDIAEKNVKAYFGVE